MKRFLMGCFLFLLVVGIPQCGLAGDEKNVASNENLTEVASERATSSEAPRVSLAAEIEQLKLLLEQQEAQLAEQRAINEKQSSRLAALESAVASTRGAAALPDFSANASQVPSGSIAAQVLATPGPNDSGAAKSDSSPLFFKIGNANFTPGGFLDLAAVFRSKTVGSGIGTSFGTIPYAVASSFPAAALSELRMSSQISQVTLKVDSQIGRVKVLGNVETDFLGNNGATMYVTSNSATLRLRVAFADVSVGRWEVLAGQAWSLLTPNRKGLSPMTADVFYSVDADSNYQLGIPWARQPQLRVVYHPNNSWALGFSAENPQQFVGSAVTLPSSFSSAQIDTNGAAWGTNTNTPNAFPDMIAKVAYDAKWGGKAFHLDGAAMLREFKVNTFVAASGAAPQVNANSSSQGRGFSFNSNLEFFKNFHLIENAYWSAGGGRYVLGLAPDFVVLPANSSGVFNISPLRAASWLAGFEWQALPKIQLYGYSSGVYADRQYVSVSSNAGCGALGKCGYGFPGSASTNNRTIEESTFGMNRMIWGSPEFGKLIARTQVSYLNRNSWSAASGAPGSANLVMGYVALKYVLP